MKKLLQTMGDFVVSFQPSEEVYNLVSKAVLPSTTAEEFLNHYTIGNSSLEE